jgi:hypothetical protein
MVRSTFLALSLCAASPLLPWPLQAQAAGLTARPIEIFLHTWILRFDPPRPMTAEEQLIAKCIDQITLGRFVEARRTLEELKRKSAGGNDAILVAGLRRLAAIRRIALPGGGYDFGIDYPHHVAVESAPPPGPAGNCRTDEAGCLRYFLQLAEGSLGNVLPDTPQQTDYQPLLEELQAAVRNRWIEAVDTSRLRAVLEVSPKSLTVAEPVDAVQAKCRRLTEAPTEANSRAFLVVLNIACGDLLAAPYGPVSTLGFSLARELRVAAGPRVASRLDATRYRAASNFYEKAEALAKETENQKLIMAAAFAEAYITLYRNPTPPIKEFIALARQAEAAGFVENAAILYAALGAFAASKDDLTHSFALVTANDSWGGLAAVIGVAHSLSTYSISRFPTVTLENLLLAISALPPPWNEALSLRTADLEASLARVYLQPVRLEPEIAAVNRAIAIRERAWASTPSRFPADHWTYYRQSEDLLLLAALLQSYSGMANTPFTPSVRNEIKTKLQAVAAHMSKPPDIRLLEAHWRLFDNGKAIYDAYVSSDSCAEFNRRYAPLRRELIGLTNLDSVLGIDELAFVCDESVKARDAAELDRNDPMPAIERFIRRARSGKDVDVAQLQKEYEQTLGRFPYWISEATTFEDSPILLRWADRIDQLVNSLNWPQGRWLARYLRAAAWNIDRKYAQALEALQLVVADPDSDGNFANVIRAQRTEALAGLGRAEESLVVEEQEYESEWRTTIRRTGLDLATVGPSAELARLDRLAANQALSPRDAARRSDLLNLMARQRPSGDRLPSAEDIHKTIAALDSGVIVLRYGEVGRFLYLWRITKGSVTIARLPQPSRLTMRYCAQLSRLLREHLDGWQGLATDLHKTLIPAGSITPGARVIVIGSDLLSSIPFEILGPIRGPALLASNTIIYSKRILGNSKYQAMASVSPSQALVVGLNSGGLTMAEQEAAEIAGILGSERATGVDATKEKVTAVLPKKNWVHFATHGALFPDNIYSSYLSLYGGERIELWELLNYFQGGVMVLSACDSFRGVSTPSSRPDFGSIGQLALAAGAHWVIANLWQVDDRISAKVMTDFYQKIRSGRADLASALQAAKQQAATTYQDDPFYYASWVAWVEGIR